MIKDVILVGKQTVRPVPVLLKHDVFMVEQSMTKPSVNDFEQFVKAFQIPTLNDLNVSKHRKARLGRAQAKRRKRRAGRKL